jgi:hypothetical protein
MGVHRGRMPDTSGNDHAPLTAVSTPSPPLKIPLEFFTGDVAGASAVYLQHLSIRRPNGSGHVIPNESCRLILWAVSDTKGSGIKPFVPLLGCSPSDVQACSSWSSRRARETRHLQELGSLFSAQRSFIRHFETFRWASTLLCNIHPRRRRYLQCPSSYKHTLPSLSPCGTVTAGIVEICETPPLYIGFCSIVDGSSSSISLLRRIHVSKLSSS